MEQNYLERHLDCNLDCDLDHDPADVPVFMEHSYTTKGMTLLFIVQSLLHCNPPYIWIKIIQIGIGIKCLHGKKILYLDHDLDNFALCKWGFRILHTQLFPARL